jgi:PAS domain S-box-containing protein
MPVSHKNRSRSPESNSGALTFTKVLTHRKQQIILPIILILIAGLGWLLVYIQYSAIYRAAYQTAQTNMIQTVEIITQHLEGWQKTIPVLDEAVLQRLAHKLSPRYQLWVYSEQAIIYDPFKDARAKGTALTPKSFLSQFPQKDNPVMNNILAGLKEGRQGSGTYWLDPEEGMQIIAWAPFMYNGHLYQAGIRIPFKKVVANLGINRSLFYSVMLCIWGNILSLLMILAWLQRFKYENQILASSEELERKVIERTRQLESVNCQLLNDMEQLAAVEKALRESEKKYRLLVETTPNGIIYADMDYYIRYCNRQAAQIAGFSSPDQMIGLKAFDIIAPEDKEKSCEYLEKILRDGFTTGIEVRILHPDGTRVPVEMNISLTRDENGKALGFTVVSQDITERKQQQDEIRENENRLKVILAHHPGLIWVVNRDMQIIRVWGNSAKWDDQFLSKILHKNIHTVLQEMDFEFITDNNHDRVLEGESLSYRFKWNGSLYDCHLEPIRNFEGKIDGAVGVAFDVTEKVRIEEELMKTVRLDSLGYLAAGIAHDFNNILTGILGNISMIRLQPSLEKETVERLQEAENAVQQASKLTGQLLTFAKGGEPVKEFISLAEIVKEMSQFACRGSNSVCVYDLQPHLPALYADKGQIGQVIHNLVLNSIQAMPNGGEIHLSLKSVEITDKDSLSLPAGPYLLLSVQDQGTGIEKEILPKIFDPFFTNKPNGTGLGLATCYSIVKRHGGHIEVESSPGEGALFKVYLPVVEEKKALRADVLEAVENKPVLLESGNGRILVMDDEVMIQKLVVRMLEYLGYKADAVKDGVEAIQYYREAMNASNPYRAVIMDLTIPGGMGGKEALAKIMEIDPSVCAIVSSGYSNDPVIANYQKFGFTRAISKPFRFEELAAVLKEILS